MTEADEKGGAVVVDDDAAEGDLSAPCTSYADDTSAPAKTDNSQELMTFFCDIVSVDSVDNILDNFWLLVHVLSARKISKVL
eukprot:15104920-Ditylum_brightwellii.AAC.1